MTKKRKDYKFSAMTIQQINELAAEWETNATRVLELLIDRAYADLIRERARTFRLTEREAQFFRAGLDPEEDEDDVETYCEYFVYAAIRSRWPNLPAADESKIYDAWQMSAQYRELIERKE